jgi:hypothetical protein
MKILVVLVLIASIQLSTAMHPFMKDLDHHFLEVMNNDLSTGNMSKSEQMDFIIDCLENINATKKLDKINTVPSLWSEGNISLDQISHAEFCGSFSTEDEAKYYANSAKKYFSDTKGKVGEMIL